jgi:hypothetical protein
MVTCGGARAEAWPCAWERGGAETVALFGCAATLEKASTGCKTVRLSSTGDRYYLFFCMYSTTGGSISSALRSLII